MKIDKDKIILAVDRIMEYFLYGLIFFIPISNAGIESFFGFLLLFFFIKKFLRPDFEFLLQPVYYALLFFVLFNALSFFNSGPYLKKSFIALVFKWLEYIFIFIITRDTLSDKRRIRNAIIVFLCVGFLVLIDGVFQFLWKTDFLRHKELVHVANYLYAITASFQHYNDFGTYLVMVFAISSASLLLEKKNQPAFEIFLWFIMLLSEICLLLTFSRGSWLNFAFVFILMLLLARRVRLLYMLGVFVIVLIAMPIVKDRIMFTFHPLGDADRFVVWHAAFRMIKEHPFLGKGVGTFMAYFRDYTYKNIQYAHNCFLQIWAEAGIFSLISFLSFLGFLLWGGFAAFKKSRNFIILGFISGISGFLLHSFFDTQFYSLQLSALFWTMAGVLQASVDIETANNKGEI